MLVGEQRVLLYWCLNYGQWVIFTVSFLLFCKDKKLGQKLIYGLKENVQFFYNFSRLQDSQYFKF